MNVCFRCCMCAVQRARSPLMYSGSVHMSSESTGESHSVRHWLHSSAWERLHHYFIVWLFAEPHRGMSSSSSRINHSCRTVVLAAGVSNRTSVFSSSVTMCECIIWGCSLTWEHLVPHPSILSSPAAPLRPKHQWDITKAAHRIIFHQPVVKHTILLLLCFFSSSCDFFFLFPFPCSSFLLLLVPLLPERVRWGSALSGQWVWEVFIACFLS